MSIIGSNILAGAAGSGVSAYEIEQSLRFNYSEQVLSRTPSANGNKDKFTWSGWVKRTKLGRQVWLFGAGGSNNPREGLNFTDSDQFDVASNTGYAPLYNITSTAKYRDPSAWYHVMYVYDSAQATASNRIKLYINGSQITDLVNSTYPSQNGDAQFINGTSQHAVGGVPDNNGLLDAYLAEVIFADGQALSPTDFGEYDDNGVWRPIDPSGITFGTQGYYLKFDPTATNGVGHDHSGNGNNFTATGFTTSGTGTDVMSDTPTTNFATLNPILPSLLQVKDGNLICDSTNRTTNYTNTTLATMGVSSGKWYYEATVDSGSMIVGWAKAGVNLDYFLGVDSLGWSYSHSGQKWNNNSAQTYGATYTTGDVIGCALDLSAGTLEFFKNGTSQGVAFTGLSGEFFPGVGDGSSSASVVASVNFGQRAFAYTPPTGYVALNTSNLPAPTVKDGSDYFNTVLYTGNGSTQSITGVGFQPDWIWCKTRNSNSKNTLTDAVRGADRQLWSDLTTAEQTNSTDFITSFDSDGFTSGPSSSGTGSTNENNGSFVAWNWLAGNGTSSNTDGSITSTVSANPTAGFSIVSYTGTGANATVGHGLGVAPRMMIIKNRDSGVEQWHVYHESIGNGYVVWLNSSAAKYGSYSDFWNSTSPTSTVFTVGTANGTNKSGDDLIAYCFAEVENYSKFSSYTGNGNANGPFVYCGFKPAWIMVKNTTTAQGWYISDNKRDTYNQVNRALFASSSSAESSATTGAAYDFLSNGFKPRTSNNDSNGSNDVYVFMAFAENPFGGSGVSPATAR